MKISQRIKIGWFCSTIWNCAIIQQHSDSWLGRGNGNEWNGLEPRMVSDLSREYEDVFVILAFLSVFPLYEINGTNGSSEPNRGK